MIVAVAFVAGAVCCTTATFNVARSSQVATNDVVLAVVFGAAIATSWMWPLIIYRGKESEAVHLDEAALVVMALLLPWGLTVLVFSSATLLAQVLRRRAVAKTVFNFGQVSAAVGLALLVSHSLSTAQERLTLPGMAAVTLAAGVFFVVNCGAVTAILAATGTPWRSSILDGMLVRLTLVAAGVAVGILLALAISAYRWSLILAVLFLLVLRHVLAAQFSGLHDRTRLRGLLDATVRVNRHLQEHEVRAAMTEAVQDLLRCPNVFVGATPPGPGQLGARLRLADDDHWLVASGRSRAEPFDAADAALLDTLAAVGAVAMNNALLHQQVGYERERLAAITWSLGEGVCAFDAAGELTFSNPATAAMLGWNGPAAHLPAGQAELADGLTAFMQPIARRAMDSLRTIRDDDATFLGRDGPLPVAFTASAILDEGTAVGAVIAFRDLRDQKAIEEDRRRMSAERQDLERQLHQSQRLESLGQLAGGVAHDFNNLLAVIANYATFVDEMIQDAMNGPDGQEWQGAHRDIEQIESAVRRAAALVHQLLAFARREVVQPKALDLNQLVVGTEQLLGRTIGQHIDLTTSLMPDLGIVIADHGQIEQLLINLAINARDAMPQGGRLTIATSELVVERPLTGMPAPVPPGRYARLQIVDTGTGMPSHVLSRVFEPFFTTKPKGEGSGLGLATVYGIVAQAGGHVQITSEQGIGTTCTVLLPITGQVAEVEEERNVTPATGGGQTVLVVEDEAALREVTERLLARNGYHVLAARDGEHAIELAAHHPAAIDVLLTDLIMPKVLGREVAQRVAALRPNIAVLYMSGFPEPILSGDGNLEPGAALLEKPFSEPALIEKLVEVAPAGDRTATR